MASSLESPNTADKRSEMKDRRLFVLSFSSFLFLIYDLRNRFDGLLLLELEFLDENDDVKLGLLLAPCGLAVLSCEIVLLEELRLLDMEYCELLSCDTVLLAEHLLVCDD